MIRPQAASNCKTQQDIILPASFDGKNKLSTNVDAKGDGTYKFYFKTENLKLIPGSYDVTVSSKNISHFKNGKTQYWIALEPESTYSA